MLVVTSNWWVTDGTLTAPPPRRFVDRFRAEVRRSSLRCGFGTDGRYRPVGSIDIVLAGDTFDWLVSREWTGDIRPWHGGIRAAAARERVAGRAAVRGRRLLATLAGWTRRGIPVPVADKHGRPAATASRVPVSVAMLSGDRDRWLEVSACGRAGPSAPAAVGTCWSDGDVTVQHGAAIDPLHAAADAEPTLGESLAVDLIAAYGAAVHEDAACRPLAAGLLRELAGGCLGDAGIRLAGWLAARGRDATLTRDARQRFGDAWQRAIDRWHRAARRLPPRRGDGVDIASRVAGWLSLDAAGRNGGAWQSTGWFPAAPPEIDSRPAGTIVLGHPPADGQPSPAHRSQLVCLGVPTRRTTPAFPAEPVGPGAVIIHPGRHGRLVDRLPLGGLADGAGDAVNGQKMPDGPRGVWLSHGLRRERGIVEAA